MLLSRKAREQGDGPEAAAPAARQPQHPAANETRRKVLLADRRLAAPPPVAELAEIGKEHIDEKRVARRRRESAIDGRLRRRLVEPLDRRGELGPGGCGGERGNGRLRSVSSVRDLGRRLGGGQTVRQVLLHEPDALEVVEGVEPQTAGRPDRVEEAVPPLPRAQQLRAHARTLAQLTDP